jgi:hypothetical protein
MRELNEDVPDAARGSVDEDPLTGRGIKPVQELQGGGASEWKGGRLSDLERGWPHGHQPLVGDNLLGVCTPARAPDRQQSPHSVADSEIVDELANLHDAPGEFVADNVWRHQPRPSWVGSIAGVDRVDAGCLDRDLNLGSGRRTAGHFDQPQDLRATWLLDYYGPPHSPRSCQMEGS